jgi:4-amino-4-deoxy-L-arabinose transferase-like glycosyltransferase
MPAALENAPGRPSRAALIALVVILAVAGWLRLAGLGRLSFWADEFPHAVAARSMIQGHGPVLPSGREYRRALAHTTAVAASMKVFGEHESAARVPSALLGLATVPALWFALRRRFGETAALVAAGVLAVMPVHVAHSRSARFYAPFALAYLAAAVLGSRAIATGSRRAALGAVVAFALAVHLQIVAVELVLPLGLYALILWWRAVRVERRTRTLFLLTTAALVAAAGISIALVPSIRDHVAGVVRNPVPSVELGPGIHLEPVAHLFRQIAWWAWIPLAPLALTGLRRAGAAGANLVAQAVVPVLAVSLLYRPGPGASLIDQRYFLHLVPFMAGLAGVGAAEGIRRMRALAPRAWRPAGAAVLVGATVLGSGATPAFALPSEGYPGLIPRPDWKSAAAVVRAERLSGEAVLTTAPLALAWELGRCGDWLRNRDAARPYMIGGRDVYCGSRLIPDLAAVRSYFEMHPHGWLVADRGQWRRWVDHDARLYITQRAMRIPLRDRTALVYRW